MLVNASAVGYYGPHGMEIVTEETPPGDTFLAQLCVKWEAATAVARNADVRVVNLRTGLVLGKDGGLLPKLSLLTRLLARRHASARASSTSHGSRRPTRSPRSSTC